MSYILGISAFYHDSAATLMKDGRVVCAFQEERFTRIKQDKSFPLHAIRACLAFAEISLENLQEIAFYEDPDKKYDRILSTYWRNFPRGLSLLAKEFPKYRASRRVVKTLAQNLRNEFGVSIDKIRTSEHHLSHAASAYYPSPFGSAAVLCIDGVGEWATVSAWHGSGKELTPLWTIDFPHSLGLLYSAFTYFCGFKVDSGEYKLMGLAPYGNPIYVDIIEREIIKVEEDGTFVLNRDYFDYETGVEMTSPRFDRLFNGPRRLPEAEITQREMDLAASVQVVTEKVVKKLVARLRRETGEDNLCLAGGVALNCVANGKLLKDKLFQHIFVQPASGDSGGSLGAAYVSYFATHPDAKKYQAPLGTLDDDLSGSYLGNSYSDAEIRSQLDELGARYEILDQATLIEHTSQALAKDQVVGWFQGRMEFGPRALGGRSILGNPRSRDMQRTMNLKIKNRESFRPFAPAILAEHVQQWFDLDTISPYMLIVADLKEERKRTPSGGPRRKGLDKVNEVRADIPAVIHVDYSARIQTVDGKHNPLFRALLESFYEKTGCPILINTSFNVRGEPIVESPADAFTCFMRTEMDYLVVGSVFLKKSDQQTWTEEVDWRAKFELD